MPEKNLICPHCGTSRLIKSGIIWSGHNKRQRYACLDCHGTTIKPITKEMSNINKEENK